MSELMEIVNLHKAFGTNQVLNGIDTTIQNGEVVVVIGPSGSGKSTFLSCLIYWKYQQKDLLYLKESI